MSWCFYLQQVEDVHIIITSVPPPFFFPSSAFHRRLRTSFASTTAECWGTAPTPTREPSTAWSENVTSVTTMERWQTRRRTTSGSRCSILISKSTSVFDNRASFEPKSLFHSLVFCPCSWTRCVLMTTAAALLRTDWPCHSYRSSCWRTTVRTRFLYCKVFL